MASALFVRQAGSSSPLAPPEPDHESRQAQRCQQYQPHGNLKCQPLKMDKDTQQRQAETENGDDAYTLKVAAFETRCVVHGGSVA